MTISSHRATVGRDLWLWMPSLDGVKDSQQAFHAKVLHVHQDGSVDVSATTHTGAPLYLEALEVHDPADPAGAPEFFNHHSELAGGPYCTWMPYQKQQMDATKTS